METMMSTRQQDRESLVELAKDVAVGTKDLLAAHGAQFKAEIQVEANRAEIALYELSFGGVMIFIGLSFLLISIVMYLQEKAGLSGGAAWAVIGLGSMILGLIGAQLARYQLRKIHVLPQQTLHSLEESLTWITKR